MKRIVLSLDSAFKTGSQADFSAIQVWGETANGFYLLTAWRGRVEYPELRRTLLSFCEQWKPEVVLIEDAASGQSLLQELRETTSLPLKPIKPDRDKISRAEAVTPLLEAGRVFLPQDAPWLNDFLDELSAFPNGAHDDAVDACTQALTYLRGRGTFGLLELVKTNWDGFVSTFRATPILPKPAKTLEHFQTEQKGLVSADAEQFRPELAAPCPACASTLTVRISLTQSHCNSCGAEISLGVTTSPRPQRRDWLRVH